MRRLLSGILLTDHRWKEKMINFVGFRAAGPVRVDPVYSNWPPSLSIHLTHG